MGWKSFGVLVCMVCASAFAEREWLEVNILQGTVRGQKDSEGNFYGFYNIPYATAPTGENKFKPPLPPPVWLEPYDAVDKGIICPQHKTPFIPSDLLMQEDCLVANVFVPDTEDKSLPVIIYVHGGAFQVGHGNLLKSRNLMKTKDIIIVTFNHRLGAHGFLCLGTDNKAPGNAGMKDMLALLKWVNKNIVNFGGNPEDVTLAGFSAGSAAVDLLMLVKSAEGLFHRVIPESGASLAAFTVQPDPLKNAKEFAQQLKFTDVEDVNALEKFYVIATYEELTSDWFFDRQDSIFLFSPCVERNVQGAFLTRSPLSLLKEGLYKKLPLLYGFAEMEGLLRAGFFDVWAVKMNEKFSDFLPADLKFQDEQAKEEIAKKIKGFYFGDEPIGPDTVQGYVNYFSDVIFVYPALRAVRLHAQAGHNQVYLYEYSFTEQDTPVGQHANVRGAPHCAQTGAVFDGLNITTLDESILSPEYTNMKKIVRQMWRDFVKTGKPVPEGSDLPAWPAAGADRSPHMSLTLPPRLRGALLPERASFWDHIYDTYYREPIPPPEPNTR